MFQARFFLTLILSAGALLSLGACADSARNGNAPAGTIEPTGVLCQAAPTNGVEPPPVSIDLKKGQDPAAACPGKIVDLIWQFPRVSNIPPPLAADSPREGGSH